MPDKRVLVTGASIAGPATAFWMRRLGWAVVLLERAADFRQGGQNIDVRGPGRDALRVMGLLDAVKQHNTTEQAWTFVDADNEVVARFGKEDFGSDGPTAELEILRGDLARIIDDACQDVEHRYGDSIVSLSDDGAGVDVVFEKGQSERFDLVVVAEGAGSTTRELVFGDAVFLKPFGLSSAYFSIEKARSDGEDARWFNAPGGRSVFLRPDPVGRTRVVLSVQQDPQGWDDLKADEQKRVIADCFADAGWETPRVLDGMWKTQDFYFHSIAQVKMQDFSKGRIALTGDAGWAVMGSGTTLALIGPYVLAGELAAGVEVSAALAQYNLVMRPFVDKAQDVPSWGAKALQPQSRLGIGLQHGLLKLAASPAMRPLMQRFASTGSDLPELPEYAELAAIVNTPSSLGR